VRRSAAQAGLLRLPHSRPVIASTKKNAHSTPPRGRAASPLALPGAGKNKISGHALLPAIEPLTVVVRRPERTHLLSEVCNMGC
jgi:hypothetical protein